MCRAAMARRLGLPEPWTMDVAFNRPPIPDFDTIPVRLLSAPQSGPSFFAMLSSSKVRSSTPPGLMFVVHRTRMRHRVRRAADPGEMDLIGAWRPITGADRVWIMVVVQGE